MKIYVCGNCGNTVYFHNRVCVKCGHRLGFSPETLELHALSPLGHGRWQPIGQIQTYRFCENAKHDVCNWLVADEDHNRFCRACRHNRLIPNDMSKWRRISEAQRHLVYAFLKWSLPAPDRHQDPQGGLVFDYLEDQTFPDGTFKPSITGHDEGVISIRAAEADDSLREAVRSQMNEPYRTLLGHFRHESGHFIWNQMVRNAGQIAPFRQVFGDESLDYDLATQHHYREGPPKFWKDSYISAYASMHPWEDFAETFAHVLHITDALETAQCYDMGFDEADEASLDPYRVLDFKRLAEAWVPLSVAINSIHKAMGERPLYPFILTPKVKQKLNFVHRLITRQPI
jgi:hypothetical protein